MNRKHPRAKWPLPTTINPATSTCWAVPVPDDPSHKAAFLGALQTLASAIAWQDDTSHTAKDVAKVWRNIADSLAECTMIQFRQNQACVLEYSLNGGSTWAVAYDGTQCLQANPDQPGGVIPDAGTCEEFLVNLRPGDLWVIPFGLVNGDTIELISPTGIWSDSGGSILYCADGAIYSAGSCSGGAPSGLDPVPTANHMSVIAGYAGPNYFAVGTSPVTISGVTGTANIWLQANEVFAGATNAGSVSFKARICRAGWTHVFDFSAGAQGWSIAAGLGSFVTDHFECHPYDGSANSGVLRVVRSVPFARTIVGVSWNYTNNDSAGSSGIRAYPVDPPSGSPTHNYADSDALHDNFVHRQPLILAQAAATLSLLYASDSLSLTPVSNLYSVVVQGLGTDPF